MSGEGLTLEQVDAKIAQYDLDPNLGNRKHEPTRGDWMWVRESILREQEGLGELIFDSSALNGDLTDQAPTNTSGSLDS